jgi:membrane-bound serine protease (ClpP class)
VSLSVILSMVITLVVITLIILHRAVKSLTYPIATGAQGLAGQIGEASTDLDLEGTVFVHGEYWRARTGFPTKRGEKVRVVRVKGLSLEVEPQRTEHKEKGEL